MILVTPKNRDKFKEAEKTLETGLIFMPFILDDNVPTIVNGSMDSKIFINSHFITKENSEKLNKLYKEIITKCSYQRD